MALGSTQPLTEMSTRSISWGKGDRCVRLTTYQHPVQACNGTDLPLLGFKVLILKRHLTWVLNFVKGPQSKFSVTKGTRVE